MLSYRGWSVVVLALLWAGTEVSVVREAAGAVAAAAAVLLLLLLLAADDAAGAAAGTLQCCVDAAQVASVGTVVRMKPKVPPRCPCRW